MPGSINANCLVQINALMALPATLEVLDKQGNVWTTAELRPDGSIVCHANGMLYSHPSALRDQLIAANAGTYKYFRHNGQTLHDLGVGP
jgi:hypothetical protein